MPVDRTCQWCEKQFCVKPSVAKRGDAKCCSRSCAANLQWMTQRKGVGYRDIRAIGHPLANKNGTAREHRIILFDRIGPGSHPCHWCGKAVTWRYPGADWGTPRGCGVLITDHLDGDKRDNSPDNLVPSCHRCNVWRNPPQVPIEEGELFIVKANGERCRAVKRLCERCSAEFLVRKTPSRLRDARFCSMSCAARSRGRS